MIYIALVVNNSDVVVLLADAKINDKAEATTYVNEQEVTDRTVEKSKANEHNLSTHNFFYFTLFCNILELYSLWED